MKYIQTITSANLNNSICKDFVHLTSPSKKRPTIPKDYYYIVDCHTHYLTYFVKDIEIKFNHYVWLLENLKSIVNDKFHIVVVPDFEKVLPIKYHDHLISLWVEYQNTTNSKLLANPNSLLFDHTNLDKVVGYYHYPDKISTIHSKWNHIFGRQESINQELLESDTIVTYDSISNVYNSDLLSPNIIYDTK